MKRTALIIILSLLFTSCNHFGERWYCIWIQNDSHKNIIALFDLDPHLGYISDHYLLGHIDSLSSTNFMPERWEEYGVKDSVYLYILDSEILFGDGLQWGYLESIDITYETIIAHIPYKYTDLYDKNSAERSRITIHFPPSEESNTPIVYYNGYSAEDFK